MKEKDTKNTNFIKNLTFDKTNYTLFFLGIITIIVGYFLMAKGEVNSTQALSIAPVVLLIGYLVIIPLSILYKKKNKDNNENREKVDFSN